MGWKVPKAMTDTKTDFRVTGHYRDGMLVLRLDLGGTRHPELALTKEYIEDQDDILIEEELGEFILNGLREYWKLG